MPRREGVTTSSDTAESVDALSRVAGGRVRAARVGVGLSQVALAKRAGVARQTLVLLESGHLRPRLDTLGHLADALGVPAALLVSPDPAVEREQLREAIDHLSDEALFAVALVVRSLRAGTTKPASTRVERRDDGAKKRTSRVRRRN